MKWWQAMLVGLALPATGVAAAEKPNIIYVMIDDAGYGDLGGDVLATPAFDRMTAEGTLFTDHYSGSAVCAPTRCVLMTGLHTGHCRRRDNTTTAHQEDFDGRPLVFLEPEDLTLAEVLHEAGYVTGGIGKWGLGNPGSTGEPRLQGFDHWYGYLDQVHAHSQYPDELWQDDRMIPLPGNAGEAEGTYSHELFEEQTLSFLKQYQDKPFFLYLAYTLPHGDYVIPHDDPAYQQYADRDWPQQIRNYAGMVTRVDRSVGKVLDLLAELGIDENTIVFYTSDNGPNPQFARILGSDGGLRGIKRQLYEGGIRAKMAVRWPGHVPAGATSDFVWSMLDLFPTCCDMAGIETPEHLDGHSVLPALLGKEQEPHPFVYWEIFAPAFQQAVRKGDWKGVRSGTKEPLALYDLARDEAETDDVAAQHAEVVKEITAIMDQQHVDNRYWPVVENPRPRGRGGRRTPE